MKTYTKFKLSIITLLAIVIYLGYKYPKQAENITYKTCDLIFKKNSSQSKNDTINFVKTDTLNQVINEISNEKQVTIEKINTDSLEDKQNRKIVIPLKKDESGLYYIISKINNVPIKFILDTGCSHMSLSQRDIDFLLNHDFISTKDVNGSAISTYADGSSELTKMYNIKELSITDSITLHDLTCTVSPNDNAPALLGQEALSQLGLVTIDYKNHQIIIN